MTRMTTMMVLAALMLPVALIRAAAPAENEKTKASAGEDPPRTGAELIEAFDGKKWFWEKSKVGDEMILAGDKSVVPAMAELLASEDRHLRCVAGSVLAGLGDERGLAAVIRELQDRDERPVTTGGPIARSDGQPDVQGQITSDRYYAAWTLGHMGDKRAVPALIETLKDKSIDYEAAIVLGDLGDERAIPALHEFLKTAAPARNKLWAGSGLAKLGDPLGLPTVIGFLKDPQWVYRRHAARALGHYHDKVVVAALIEATKDESADVRVIVVRALGEIGDPSAVEALEALADDEAINTSGPPIKIKDAAAKALAQIALAKTKTAVEKQPD